MEFLTKVSSISKKSLDILKPLLDKEMKDSPVYKFIKDFVPGLEAAAYLAQIWSEERKKAAIPKEAAAILSEQLGIEFPVEVDKDQMVQLLKEKGVTDPEETVAMVISRLQAAVKYPELAEMLQQQHSHISKALSRNFAALQTILTAGFRVLIPLEKVLEVFTFEKTLAAPMMFRRGGPVAADLESSMAVIDKNQVQAMEGELKEKKILLIQGRAASGKTILIRSMAYHMYKSGNQRIWMLRLKEDPFDYFELIGEMNRLAGKNPPPVVVIEDIHLYKNEVASLLLRREENWPLLLLTSRDKFGPESDKGIFGLSEDQIKPQIPDQNTIKNIVKYFFGINQLEFSNNIATDYYQMVKQDLMQLNYALSSSLENGGIPDKKRMLERYWQDLSNIFARNGYSPLFPRAVLALSLLSQYEIPTDSRYLEELFGPEIYPVLEQLALQHEIFKLDQDKRFYYGLPHSNYAEQYVQFIPDSVWHATEYEDTQAYLFQYIHKPYTRNAFRIIERLQASQTDEAIGPEGLGGKLYWDIILQKFKHYKSVEHLEVLFQIADNERKEDLIEIISEPDITYRLLADLRPGRLKFLFGLFSSADPGGFKKFLGGLEFNLIHKVFAKHDSPEERLEFAFLMADRLPKLSDKILRLLKDYDTWDALLENSRAHRVVELLIGLDSDFSFAGQIIETSLPAKKFAIWLKRIAIRTASLFICNWRFDNRGLLSQVLLEKLPIEQWLADLYKEKDLNAFFRLLTVGTQNPAIRVDWDRFVSCLDLNALIRDMKSNYSHMNQFIYWCESYAGQMEAWLSKNYDIHFLDQLFTELGDGIFFDDEARLIEKFNSPLYLSMWQNIPDERFLKVLRDKEFKNLASIIRSTKDILPELALRLAEDYAIEYLKSLETFDAYDLGIIHEYCSKTVTDWLDKVPFQDRVAALEQDNDLYQLEQMIDSVNQYLPEKLLQVWDALKPSFLIDQICMKADEVKPATKSENDPFELAFILLSMHPEARPELSKDEAIMQFADKLLSEPAAGARSRSQKRHLRRQRVKASPLPLTARFKDDQDDLLEEILNKYLGAYFQCTDTKTMGRMKKYIAAVGKEKTYRDKLISIIDQITEA